MSMNINDNRPINVGDLQNMMLQQGAQNPAPGAAPKNDFKHSIFFKIITFGIGAAIVSAQDAKQAKQQAAALHAATSATAVKIFTKLNELLASDANRQLDANRQDDDDDGNQIRLTPITVNNGKVEPDILAGDFILKMDGDGRLLVKQDNDAAFVPMNVGVKELREKLANEIFSNPDLLEPGDYLEALKDIARDPNDDIDTGDSFQRRCYEQALERWGGIGADRLINLTTANLRELAGHLFDDIGTTAGGANSAVLTGQKVSDLPRQVQNDVAGPDGWEIIEQEPVPGNQGSLIDDFEIVGHSADRFKDMLEVMNQQVEARRLESEDAAVLIEALRKEPAADTEQKIKMRDAGVPYVPTRREWLQPLRDLAADLIQTQDPVTHDRNLAEGKPNNGNVIVVQALARHAETLAKLLLDETGTMTGLDEYTAEFLTVFLHGPKNETGIPEFLKSKGIGALLELEPEKIDPNMSVDELAASIRAKAAELAKGGLTLPGKTLALTNLSATLSKVATYALETMQDGIAREMDAAFKNVKNDKAIENMTIEEMYDQATKPNDGSYTAFVKEVLGQYFGALTGKDGGKYKDLTAGLEEDRRNMFAAMMRYAPDDGKDEAGYFAAAVKGAGPLMQKILQGLDANMLGDNALAAALKDMKKNLAPLPEEYVKAQLLDIVSRSNGSITRIERVKSLGCASVAQAILCRVHGPGMPEEGKMVVVKLQRPNALTNLNREKELILRMAENVKMRTTYEGMIDTILEEFDFIGEENNIKAGEIYDTGFPRVKAVKADPLVPTTPTSLVMECAPGETVADELEVATARVKELRQHLNGDYNLTDAQRASDIAELQTLHEKLVKYQKDLSDLSTKWVTEGLFGSGMFHGDLHGGNIMVSERAGVTLIDFGNMTRLTEKEQCAITKMAAAASIGNTKEKNVRICVDEFLDGLATLLGPTQRANLETVRDVARTMIGYTFKAGSWQDAGKRIFVALAQLQEIGVEIPPQIFKFSQSQMRLQSAVDNVTNLVKDTTATLRSLTATHGLSGRAFYMKSLFSADPDFDDLLEAIVNPGFSSGQAKKCYSKIHTRVGQLQKLMKRADKVDPMMKMSYEAIARLLKIPETDGTSMDLLMYRESYRAMLIPPMNEQNQPLIHTMAGRFANDEKFTAAYDQYRACVERYPESDPTNIPEELAQAIAKMTDAIMEAELTAIESHAKDLRNLKPSKDNELKSFCQSMGNAIKQNLKAATKRIGMKLYRASV